MLLKQSRFLIQNYLPKSVKYLVRNSKSTNSCEVIQVRTLSSDYRNVNVEKLLAEIKTNLADLKTKQAKLLATTSTNDTKCDQSLQKLHENIEHLERNLRIEGFKFEDRFEFDKSKIRKPKAVNYAESYLERNFITPSRALREFALKQSDIDDLPMTKRRSPFETNTMISVYWRKDVLAKAIHVWGSLDNLHKELVKRKFSEQKYQQDLFMMKQKLRDFRKEQKELNFAGFNTRSGRVVVLAIGINFVNFLMKLVAWIYTGSHSMFSECIHSLADTINQFILAYGVHKSTQMADSNHPYGYANMKSVSSLISGVGIFCSGTLLSLYHGVTGLLNPTLVGDFSIAFFVLGTSFLTEGVTFLIALNSVRKGAKENKLSVRNYILRGQEPSVNVILMEDFAAVFGVLIASSCMALSIVSGSHVPDSIGSLLIGGLLGCVASVIIYTNTAPLVVRSIPHEIIEKINSELESDPMIRAVHDVKGIDMGNNLIRYKAEVDIDSEQLAQVYLDKQDFDTLFKEIKQIKSFEEYEANLLHHSKRIVDSLGPEIDRIESAVKGWNDVSFHGSGEIPTPNIDALAYSGIILNRYYVTPICTPSRSALFTGRYPIHTQMQHRTIYGAEPRGLPLNNTLLSEYLKDLGYSTHIVGKWHLGHFKKVYTPLYRGFDSHFGFWTGHQDYYNHRAYEDINKYYFEGLDMRRNLSVADNVQGNYSTHLFTHEAKRLIESHNRSNPLFLYVSYGAVHSANPKNPLQAPQETIDSLRFIESKNRRKYAAMVVEMDKSIGEIIESLRDNNLLDNSIVVFSTDNGGPADGFNRNYASNYPLRGVKNTLWEGGVRGVGVLWSKLLKKKSFVSDYMFHIKDWLPTLYYLANGDLNKLGSIDGKNVWHELQNETSSSETEILHNIDDVFGTYAVTRGDFKLLKGSTYKTDWDGWYGTDAGRNYTYNYHDVLNSTAGQCLELELDKYHIFKLREKSTLHCQRTCTTDCCDPNETVCLFNIVDDPCENFDLSNSHPEIVNELQNLIESFNRTALPPNNARLDPNADPQLWNDTWTNFGDYEL